MCQNSILIAKLVHSADWCKDSNACFGCKNDHIEEMTILFETANWSAVNHLEGGTGINRSNSTSLKGLRMFAGVFSNWVTFSFEEKLHCVVSLEGTRMLRALGLAAE